MTLFKIIAGNAIQAHNIAVEKGFWENAQARNKGEMVMLMVTELAEAVEAHRKNQVFDYDKHTVNILVSKGSDIDFWTFTFEFEVKNKIQDEIADTIIRILDYVQGFQLPLIEREYRKEPTGNFANDILRINHYILQAFHNESEKDWGYALAAIIKVCEWWDINHIDMHIFWKMFYNSNRPYKHGKAY